MSEATTLALPVAHEIAHHARHHAHATLPAELSIAFRSARWRVGLGFGAGGTVMLAVGAFLLSQIAATPALTAQLAILGSLGIVGGLALLTKSVRDLFGRLVINDDGIAVRPVFAGFSISWNELTNWEVKVDRNQHPDVPAIRFWTQGTLCPLFVSNGWLNDEARDHIRHALWTRASNKNSDPK